MVERGPEDGHSDETHVAQGRAEAVQQELVRVWPAARAAPEGAVQAQGLVCQEVQTILQLCEKPSGLHTVRSLPACRCHYAGSESCREPAKAVSLQGLRWKPESSTRVCVLGDRHTARPRKAKAAGRTDALLRD